jgi:hypothetical protein
MDWRTKFYFRILLSLLHRISNTERVLLCKRNTCLQSASTHDCRQSCGLSCYSRLLLPYGKVCVHATEHNIFAPTWARKRLLHSRGTISVTYLSVDQSNRRFRLIYHPPTLEAQAYSISNALYHCRNMDRLNTHQHEYAMAQCMTVMSLRFRWFYSQGWRRVFVC